VTIEYQLEPDLTQAEFIHVLVRSRLAERRPIDRPDVIRAMLEGADIILTARAGERLVGVSRRDQRLRVLYLPVRPRSRPGVPEAWHWP
jgi:hypothetical protein